MLKYAWRYDTPGRLILWASESVVEASDTLATHLGVDSTGIPHIGSLSPSNEVLYCYRDTHGWYREVVATEAPYGQALALDGTGIEIALSHPLKSAVKPARSKVLRADHLPRVLNGTPQPGVPRR